MVFSKVCCKKNVFTARHVVSYTYFLNTATCNVVDSDLVLLECDPEMPSFNFLCHMQEPSLK